MTSPAGKSLKPALKDGVAAQRFPVGKQNVMISFPGDVMGGSVGIQVPSWLLLLCFRLPAVAYFAPTQFPIPYTFRRVNGRVV